MSGVSRIWRLGLVLVLVGSTLALAAPAQAADCLTTSAIRFNGPTGKYGVKGSLEFTKPTNTPCNNAVLGDDMDFFVQLRNDNQHFALFGWEHLIGCNLNNQTCFEWVAAWQDGTCPNCQQTQVGHFGNQSCAAYGKWGNFSIHSNTAGVFIFTFQCPPDPKVQLYSTADFAQHPVLSFSTARATVEVDVLGNTSANEGSFDLVKQEGLGDNMSIWPSAPTCAVDSVIGWDGTGGHTQNGGTFTTIPVSNDRSGC